MPDAIHTLEWRLARLAVSDTTDSIEDAGDNEMEESDMLVNTDGDNDEEELDMLVDASNTMPVDASSTSVAKVGDEFQ